MGRVIGMDGEALMRRVAAAFEKGDLKPLMEAIHPDIVWKTASGDTGLFRFAGPHRDRAGVLDVTSKIAMEYTFLRFQPREIVAKGDIVWGLFDAEVSYVPPEGGHGKFATFELAIRWRLKDGKVIEHQGFFDTAKLLIEQGRMVAVPR
jgi:ketosteroid isomerase-like protein